MAAATVEQDTFTIEVTDIDPTANVKCQTKFGILMLPRPSWDCDNPATKRVRTRCPDGHTRVKFICDRCLKYLFAGRMRCRSCHQKVTYQGDL